MCLSSGWEELRVSPPPRLWFAPVVNTSRGDSRSEQICSSNSPERRQLWVAPMFDSGGLCHGAEVMSRPSRGHSE